jgi:hypothetical protein
MMAPVSTARRGGVAAAIALLAVLILSAVPHHVTEATFTDAERSSAELAAGSLGTIAVSCSTPGPGVNTEFALTWTITGATLPISGFDVILTGRGGETVVLPTGSEARAMTIPKEDGEFARNVRYAIAVTARSSDAPNWAGKSGPALSVTKGHPKGWVNCA